MQACRQHGVTAAFMVPTQATCWSADPEFDADRLRSWTQAELRRRTHARLGADGAEGEAAAAAR